MEKNENNINWFEIPVADMQRAKKFYETLFGIEMQESEMMGMHFAFFPFDNMSGKVSGALVKSSLHKPSAEGAVIYLNANPDLTQYLIKVEMAGGKIDMPKTHINSESGHMAFFIDSEGNKIGLHSQN